MKRCERCNEACDDNFYTCWKCSAPLPDLPTSPGTADQVRAVESLTKPRAAFRIFRGSFVTWNMLCEEAAGFVTEVGPKQLISVSHSEDRDDGVIVVWYWENLY